MDETSLEKFSVFERPLRVIVDASSLMDGGAGRFLERLVAETGEKFIIPSEVREEISKHRSGKHRKRRQMAERASGLIRKFEARDRVEVFPPSQGAFGDSAIMIVTLQLCSHNHICLVTQDRALAADILYLNKRKSVERSKSIYAVRISQSGNIVRWVLDANNRIGVDSGEDPEGGWAPPEYGNGGVPADEGTRETDSGSGTSNPSETLRETDSGSGISNPSETLRETDSGSGTSNPSEILRKTDSGSGTSNPSETLRETDSGSDTSNPSETCKVFTNGEGSHWYVYDPGSQKEVRGECAEERVVLWHSRWRKTFSFSIDRARRELIEVTSNHPSKERLFETLSKYESWRTSC